MSFKSILALSTLASQQIIENNTFGSQKAQFSNTRMVSSKATHTWKIKDWKQWIKCSEEEVDRAVLYSDRFYVPIMLDHKNGPTIVDTCWQIVASSHKLSNGYAGQKHTLAFRLVNYNDGIMKDIRGSFNFETIQQRLLWRPEIIYKFPARPIDVGYKMNSLPPEPVQQHYHKKNDLIIRVNLNIVSPKKLFKYHVFTI